MLRVVTSLLAKLHDLYLRYPTINADPSEVLALQHKPDRMSSKLICTDNAELAALLLCMALSMLLAASVNCSC
jgi:hypothetical protein